MRYVLLLVLLNIIGCGIAELENPNKKKVEELTQIVEENSKQIKRLESEIKHLLIFLKLEYYYDEWGDWSMDKIKITFFEEGIRPIKPDSTKHERGRGSGKWELKK